MKSKITTLVENTVAQSGKKLIGEHGLSFYIETESNKILFDTGQNLAISNNARVLGMDHLREFGLEKIGVGHCTGTRAFVALFNEFPNRVFLNTVGNVVSA